jgi:predicted RNA-binding protein YlqC (UPF0109 family)
MPAATPSEEQLARTRLALELLLRQMVDEPDQVEIRPVFDDVGALIFRVRVAPRDVGKVIGAGGRNARALRTILAAISQSIRTPYRLDIDNEEAQS